MSGSPLIQDGKLIGAMTDAQKQAIVNKAHKVRSEKEMHDLVAELANGII